ncbi:MAG: ABC transporter ATP-binding protein [Propionibacteriales bacterium]|nr:ABC transporter ATP-binding protein [Propionibacteriales bacterium]
MDLLLEVRDLSVTYRTASGELPAVRGVSMVVSRGESVGIAGESGCGKSTLASTVLRLQPKSARVDGSVLVNGKDVQTVPWGELRTVRWAEAAMVFQGALHSLNPVQRIGDQIAEPIRLHDPSVSKGQAAIRVGELFEQVGLPPARARAFPHQMSGGQKQRVMMAMALACRPELIIADEPTTALDVMVQAQVLGVLTDLVRDLGLGLLLISHDLSVLGTTCDRVLVMYAGRVVEEGPGTGLFDSPLHPYGGALAAAFPRVGDPRARFAPIGLPGDPPDPRDLPTGCTFHPRCALATQECTVTDPVLEIKSPGRRAACIHTDETRDMKLLLAQRVAATKQVAAP